MVYKVDRLTRSLLNTTGSLGRLTLNILLAFAQFEREMIAERTRDKMSAARRKGRWVGGIPMLGYDRSDRGARLVVNEDEAARVRAIFDRWHAPHLFPPRLEVVVLESDSNDFPAYAGHQVSLVYFDGKQANTPASLPWRRQAAGRGNHSLHLRGIKGRLVAGARPLVDRRIQPARFVALDDLAHALSG